VLHWQVFTVDDPEQATQAEVPVDHPYPAGVAPTHGHDPVIVAHGIQAVPAVFGVYPYVQAAHVIAPAVSETP
jgi:hypothetical protein